VARPRSHRGRQRPATVHRRPGPDRRLHRKAGAATDRAGSDRDRPGQPYRPTKPTAPLDRHDELLFAITEINYYGYVRRTQRATILRVLAGLAGIGYDGETVDLAGRTGVTFRYTDVAQAATTWLTINPTTGEILAYRRVFVATGRTIFSRYWLLLDRDRREYL